MSLVALLGVLGLGVWGAFALLAANPPAAPTILTSPANPTNSTTAAFTYKDTTTAGFTRFECSKDGGVYAACGTAVGGSSISYAVTAGSHTFAVRAVYGSTTTASTSYAWFVDTTAPTVSSIGRADANPTKANPLHWTVTFSEPVANVGTGNFGLVTSGLGGTAPSISSAAPTTGTAPQASWTVTVSTAGTTGTNAGSIGLNLTAKGTIQDAAGNGLSATVPVVGQAYTFDTTAPITAAISITANAGSPTNAGSVSWTVSFGEPVKGVTPTNFALVFSGFTGTPTISSVSGSGSSWTVTAATTTTTTNTAGLQLKLSSAAGITDLAGNGLTGSLPVNGPAYTVDRFAPPAAFTVTPPATATNATAHFAWQSLPAAPDFDHYACSVENGPFSTTVVPPGGGATQPCASPLSYALDTTNNGTHQFGVRAYDHIGNYTEIDYSWKVDKGSIQEFTINGDGSSPLYPGGAATKINLGFTNPNAVSLQMTSPLTVAIQSVTAPNATVQHPCSTSDYAVTQYTGSYPFTIPPGSSTLSSIGISNTLWPTVRMVESGHNQNGCAGASVTVTYTASAHS